MKTLKSIGLLFASSVLTFINIMPVLADGVWVNVRQGKVPANAFVGARGLKNEPLYICSVGFASGKVVNRKCFIGWGGEERIYDKYKVLVGNNWEWVNFTGDIPNGAVISAYENGEDLYVCRAKYNNSLSPGKYIPANGTCYIGYGGRELYLNDFDVLVEK